LYGSGSGTSKGKGSPYSITERRVPELIPVFGSQPAADVSHKLGGRPLHGHAGSDNTVCGLDTHTHTPVQWWAGTRKVKLILILLKQETVSGNGISWAMYTVSEKKQDTKLLPITSPNVTDFQNSFTGRLTGKFATNIYLNIPPHLKYVATLPCEI